MGCVWKASKHSTPNTLKYVKLTHAETTHELTYTASSSVAELKSQIASLFDIRDFELVFQNELLAHENETLETAGVTHNDEIKVQMQTQSDPVNV